MAQARAGTVQQEREEVFAALQYAASFHCLVEELQDCEELEPKPQEKWTFANKKGKAQKHHTEWCAIAHKYRCVRCGRSSKNMKMHGTCVGPKWLTEDSTHKLGRSRRAMEVSTRNGAEGGKFPSVDEDVHRNRGKQRERRKQLSLEMVKILGWRRSLSCANRSRKLKKSRVIRKQKRRRKKEEQ